MKTQIKKSFSFCLKLDAEQENACAKFAEAHRFTYKHCFERSIKDFEQAGKRPSYNNLIQIFSFLLYRPFHDEP